MSEGFFLSGSDAEPMYSQLVAQVLAKVMAGDWPPGHALPSIRDLAAASRVSVITVKRAYLELEHAGVIVTRVGKGSFVADSVDLNRRLAQQEFQTQLDQLLVTAGRLGLRPDELLAAVSAALQRTSPPATLATPTLKGES